MKYSLIVDIIFLAIIAISITLCTKRGLFRSIAGIAGTVIGFIGARLLGSSAAVFIKQLLQPVFRRVFSSVKVQEALSRLAAKALGGIQDIQATLIDSGLKEETAELISGAFDYMGTSIGELALMESSSGLAASLAEAAADAIAPVVAFILLFIVIKLVVYLVCRLLSVNLPLLREINKLGGMILGLGSGLLMVILLCWGVVIFAPQESVGFFSMQTLYDSIIGGFITDIFW